MQPPLIVTNALLRHRGDTVRVTVAGQQALRLIDQGTRVRQWSRSLLQRGPWTKLEKTLPLGLLFCDIPESRGGINFGERAVARGKIRVLREKSSDLPYGGRSIAADQAAGKQVLIHRFVRVLHGKNLVFLSQLSQVTFDAIALHRVLIELVDQQVIRVTLAKGQQRGDILVEVKRISHDIRGLRQLGTDLRRQLAGRRGRSLSARSHEERE